MQTDQMKRLVTITAAAALLAAPVSADWIPIKGRNRPASRQKGWTRAAPLPFALTPEAFKAFINNGDFGMQVLKAEQCKFTDHPPQPHPNNGYTRYDDIAGVDIDAYSCDRTFYEIKDPRGTQRCMGMVTYQSNGTSPNNPSPAQRFNQQTLKNDCRWL